MAFPASLDTFNGTTAQGTSTLSSPDHALDHRTLGSAVGTIEQVIGTNSGTAVLMNFTAGKFAAKTVGETHGTSTWIGGTIGTALIGTSTITGGTIISLIGTSTIQGGTANNQVIGSPAITGGTLTSVLINGGTLGTPVIGTVSIPGTVTALGFSAAIAPGIGSIADAAGGTLTANAQLGNVFYTALGTADGNRTIGTPQNPTGYQQLTYALKTSGSANATAVWAGVFRFSQDVGTPSLGTGVGWNYFGWRYNPIDTKWDFQGQSNNLI